MPIYEYNCAKCGVFEVTQRITENPLRKCPTCKGKVERIVSRTSFILKGSGWYATDYSKSGSGAGKNEASTATDSSSSAAPSPSSSNGSSASGGSAASSKPAEKSTPAKSTG